MDVIIDFREKLYSLRESLGDLRSKRRVYIETNSVIYLIEKMIRYLDKKTGYRYVDKTKEDW